MENVELKEKEVQEESVDNTPLDKNVRLMSPTRMLIRRFFRSKLSVAGLIMVVSLFLFCFAGPLVYNAWGENEPDKSNRIEYVDAAYTTEDGAVVQQTAENVQENNTEAPVSADHPLGTDKTGLDTLTRLMHGGQVSLIVSFMTVFLMTIFGVLFGGLAGYFGGWVDNLIMRVCDILTCLPGMPIMLIIGSVMNAWQKEGIIESSWRIYILMAALTLISWTGIARLVRGQILSLREQEFMVAAEAMGYSTGRKIFKHLVPNVMPQLIVQMTLSLGSMILYEATLSFLGIGVPPEQAAWGSMIEVISKDQGILQNHPLIWLPAGLCIVIAVLGFNFVGDGLRDALDPKARR